jgi:hypothetical protein
MVSGAHGAFLPPTQQCARQVMVQLCPCRVFCVTCTTCANKLCHALSTVLSSAAASQSTYGAPRLLSMLHCGLCQQYFIWCTWCGSTRFGSVRLTTRTETHRRQWRAPAADHRRASGARARPNATGTGKRATKPDAGPGMSCAALCCVCCVSVDGGLVSYLN